MDDTIGIDISKDTLDIHRLSDGKHARFGNDASGLRALCRWIGKVAVRVVYEATGRYHRDLERDLAAAGHGLVKVNPGRARWFAQAIGQDAKTDRVDAGMLARMGSVLDLEAKPARTESMHEIRELHVARVGLIKDRTACRNRLQAARNRVILIQLRARLRQVDRQIAQIDAEFRRLVASDPALARRSDILLSIPGIGPIAAVALIVEMPELGAMNGKEAASLAGLAPITRQSGQWKGKSKIGGGRAGLRCGREASPTASIIDSQSVKTCESGGPRGGARPRAGPWPDPGDAGKKINGRKRHALVDTDGRALVLFPHPASIQDRDGAGPLLQASQRPFPFIRKVFVDAGYQCPRVAETTTIAVEIVKRKPDQVGFAIQPRRWAVERFFAWISRNRRLWRDAEATIESATAVLYAAAVMILVRRIARLS